MKLCDSCSTPLPDNAHVCPKCGMVLPDEEDMTIQRLPIKPEDLLAGNIAVATDEEEVTIKGWPVPAVAKETPNKDAQVPNPETPIPDMAILDRLPVREDAIAPQNTPTIQNDLDGSEDIITDDPTPTPPIFQDSDSLDDDPTPVLLATDDADNTTDDPTPVAPGIQDRDIIADDPTPVLPGTPGVDSIADDPTPLPPAEHEFSATDDDPTPVGRDAEVITDDPSPLLSLSATQQDAEAISSDVTPQLEHDSDEAVVLADAPLIETDPRMLAATLDALAALTASDDPTPVNGHVAEPQEDTITPPDWSPYVAGEEITSKNRHTAPIPLYPDYGKAKAAFAPPPAQQTGDKTDGQLPSTMPAPLYDNYQSFTGPTVSRSATASLMSLPQKIYTAYPQLLSRTGLVSLTLCLLLIISSIGLIIVRHPQGIAGQNIHPTAAKLVLVSNTLNTEVIKGSPAILPIEIGNSGTQPLTWTATHKNTPWLSLKRETGTIKVKAPDQIIDAIASTATLAEGLHNGSIQFHSSGGDASVQFAITVLHASGKKQSILNVNPPTLTFDSLQRGQQVTKTLTISNTGNAPLKWSANTDSPTWLTLNPASGIILAGGYPQPLVLTVNTATLPTGGSSAQLTISSNASQTPVTMGITINVTPSNGNALSISTNPGSFTSGCLECEVTLTASAGGPGSKSSVNWSTSSAGVSGITFSPSSGTLLAGQSIPVKVTVPNTACPASAFFDFAGDANTVPVLWSCTPPPSPLAVLTASPTDLTNCTTCTVYISPASGSQSKLSWTSYPSGINGINISPSSGTVAPGGTEAVTITVPQQNCPASADLTFLGQGPNNSTTIAWSCTAPPPIASMLSINPTSLDSSQCQANNDGTYNCSVTLTESPAGNMGWSSFSNVGGNFSLTTGQFSASSASTQVSIDNILCQNGTFGFLGSNNQVAVNWTCQSAPNLTIDTNSLSNNSPDCTADSTYGFDCLVTLGESFDGMLNWTESDPLGLTPSQSSGQLTSDNSSQQVELYYIPCMNGTITFSTPGGSTQQVSWTCTIPTYLTIDTTSLSPNSSNCSPNGDGTYYCVVNLGENSQGTINWSESDNFGSNSYISQLNGTLTPSSPTAQVVYYNIPCIPNGSITFSAPLNNINVGWTCTQPSPTPTQSSMLTVDTTSLSNNSSNCSQNSDGSYYCVLNLGENPTGTLTWVESDTLGAAVSQTSGTLTPSSPSGQIAFYNLPCSPGGVSGTITLTATNNTVSASWNCTTPAQPTLTIDTNNLSSDSGNCSLDSSYGYDCTVTLGESFAGTLNWSESDNLGPYVSPSSGQLTPGSPYQSVTLYYLPCTSGTIIFSTPNSSQTVNWSCSPPTLTVDTTNLSDTSPNCSANGDGTYYCVLNVGETPQGTLNWFEYDDLGANVSQTYGTFTPSNAAAQIIFYNIPCISSGYVDIYTSTSNSVYVNWSCSGPTPTPTPSPTVTPNLSVNPSNIDPTNTNCSSSGNNIYTCNVMLGEDQSATVNWNASDDYGLGVSFSQSSGTLSAGNTSQSITISNIPCQSGSFTFSGSGANPTTAYWSCTPSGPTPTPTTTPNLLVNPTNIDPTNVNCSSSGNNIYTCNVTLSEDQTATVDWNVTDDSNLGVSFSQSSGTLNSGNPTQGITISNIPCQNGSFTFASSVANPTTVNWSCTPGGPTPTPTATPNLSVTPGSIDPTSGYCSSNGNNIYSCSVTLAEDQSATVNWSVSDDNSLGVSFSQTSGTLSSGNTSQGITISNIPCQGGTFTFSGSGANSTTLTWSCSLPTPTPSPSPTATPNLSVNPPAIDPTNPNCSSNGNNIYSCSVTLSEDQSATINWNVTDDNSLGVSFSQSSGTLSAGNTSQGITISNIPCQGGTFTFAGSGANSTTLTWSCSQPTPTPSPTQATPTPSPTPSPTPTPTPSPTAATANLSVNPSGLNTSNCSSSGNNVYSCTVALSEDQPVTINWQASDNGLGASFSPGSGQLGPGNTSANITISNIPCQSGSFTFSGSGANNPVSVSWTCP